MKSGSMEGSGATETNAERARKHFSKKETVSSRRVEQLPPKGSQKSGEGPRTGDSTDLVHVFHNIPPARFEISDEWNSVRY